MTIDDSYKDFLDRLQGIYDPREAATIADWIFEDIAKISRLKRVTNKLTQLTPGVKESIDKALVLLMAHTPVQYVLGYAWFYKMRLKVNEHVLIPRPETEELVSWIVGDCREAFSSQLTVQKDLTLINNDLTALDIGTGSGCIAIALKTELPRVSIMAIDVSPEALSTAVENAGDKQLEIDFRQIDFLENESGNLPCFDIIVSNPPYIASTDKNKLALHVVEHEPHLALFTDKDDQLIFYRKIAEFAETNLKENGKIYVEIHEDHAEPILQIFKERMFKSTLRKDSYGRDRMIRSEKKTG